MKITRVLAVLFGLLSISANAGQLDSKETLVCFIRFVWEGKEGEASAMVFTKPNDQGAATGRVKRFIGLAKQHPERRLEVVDSKEIGTVAWVIVKDAVRRPDGKPDYDGNLMVKRDGEWKVVFNANEVEDSPTILTAEERKAVAELRSWQDKEMEKVRNAPNP